MGTLLRTLPKITQVASGQAAAVAVADLMDRTATAIAVADLVDRTATAVEPTTLVTAYAATPGGSSQAVTGTSWDQFGQPRSASSPTVR